VDADCPKKPGGRVTAQAVGLTKNEVIELEEEMTRPDTRMDRCELRIIGNDIYREDSRRTTIYFIVKDNPGINIEDIFYKLKDNMRMAEVRSDVRRHFADGKIEIEGWEVATTRTMNFIQKTRGEGW
jgi:hypothetical protein